MYLYRLREVNIIILTRGYDRLADRWMDRTAVFLFYAVVKYNNKINVNFPLSVLEWPISLHMFVGCIFKENYSNQFTLRRSPIRIFSGWMCAVK